MNELYLKSWKTLAWRGAVTLVFGILVALWPGITLLWLVFAFAAYALVAGAISMVSALQHRKSDSGWWLLFLLGFVAIAAGTLALLSPMLTAIMLLFVIGATALVTGIIDVIMGIRLRKVMHGEAFLILNGIISVVFGLAVFFFPGEGELAMVWLISAYAIVSGILLLALAWTARNWQQKRERAMGAQPPNDLTHGSPHAG